MRKVLVVDDSLSVRKVVEKALEVRGLQVLAAATGAEAITMIDRDRPDVVICDVILPDKEGYQICEYVRAHPAIGATPVLLISGIDNGTVQARAAEVRSDEVMFKPFSVEDLVRRVDKLLGGRTNGTKAPASVAAPAAASAPVTAPSPVTPARVPVVPAPPAPASATPATSAPAAAPAPMTPTAPLARSAPATAPPATAAPAMAAPAMAAPATAASATAAPVTPAPATAVPVSSPASAASVPTSRAPSTPASSSPATAGPSVKQRLDEIAGAAGVRFVVLSDREGFLIETAGDLAPDADEVAGALASCLAEASQGIGRELGQGQLVGTILEYEAGTVLLHSVGSTALLAVLVDDPGALGKVRYYVRKTVPELVRAL